MELFHRWITWWRNVPRLLRWPPWLVRDVGVFVLMAYLYFALLGMTAPIALFLDYPRSPPVGPFTTGLLWVVGTPAMIVKELGQKELSQALMLFNAMIYAATWWLVWRMWRLFRWKAE